VRWSELAISLGFGLALVVAVAPMGGRALSRGRCGLLLASYVTYVVVLVLTRPGT
jgi:hypothetical protein